MRIESVPAVLELPRVSRPWSELGRPGQLELEAHPEHQVLMEHQEPKEQQPLERPEHLGQLEHPEPQPLAQRAQPEHSVRMEHPEQLVLQEHQPWEQSVRPVLKELQERHPQQARPAHPVLKEPQQHPVQAHQRCQQFEPSWRLLPFSPQPYASSLRQRGA